MRPFRHPAGRAREARGRLGTGRVHVARAAAPRTQEPSADMKPLDPTAPAVSPRVRRARDRERAGAPCATACVWPPTSIRPARDGRPLAEPAPRPPAPHALQQDGDRDRARRVPLVRRPRLRGRQPGLPRLLPLGRGRQLPGARSRGRRRHHRVDPPPGVGERDGGLLRHLVVRLDADRDGRARARGPRDDGGQHERRRRPRELRPAGRRARAALSRVGVLALGVQFPGRAQGRALRHARRSTSAPRRSRTGSSGCPSGAARPSSPWCRPTRSGRSRSSRAPTTTTTGGTRASIPARTGIASRRCPSSSSAAGTTRTRAPRSRTSSGSGRAAGGRCAPWWARGRMDRGRWSCPMRATWSSASRRRCRASTSCTCAGTTGGCAAWTMASTPRRRSGSS